MPDTKTVPADLKPTDPDNVPVRIIDGIATFGMIGSTVNITLVTNRIGARDDGRSANDFIIAARLRFDIGIARMIRDALDSQIQLATVAEDKVN